MCGIGAIMVREGASLDAVKAMAENLLVALEIRGTDSAGIAVFYDDGRVWLRKAPVPASTFVEKWLSRIRWHRPRSGARPRIILLHARAATMCPPSLNMCNHPLWTLAGDRLVAVVHNGVLVNYPELERPVDSDAFLYGVRKRGRLDVEAVRETLASVQGSYAVLWSDGEKLVHVRNTNPTVYAVVPSVGLVFASTEEILASAAAKSGLRTSIIMDTKPCTIYVKELVGPMQSFDAPECRV